VTDDLTPTILAQIRDDIRKLDDKLTGQIGKLDERQDRTEQTMGLVVALLRGVDTRLEHLEDWVREARFLPRRVDKLEISTKRHARRISRLEKKKSE
jgi:hypothetical protein